LQNSGTERGIIRCHGNQKVGGRCTSRLSKNCDLVWIASKSADISSDPV
jgi:hypothetical protein